VIDLRAALKGIDGSVTQRGNLDLMDSVFALKSGVVGYNMSVRLVMMEKIVKR